MENMVRPGDLRYDRFAAHGPRQRIIRQTMSVQMAYFASSDPEVGSTVSMDRRSHPRPAQRFCFQSAHCPRCFRVPDQRMREQRHI